MSVEAKAVADPRVSVISIFYNAEPYFAEAIESVLAQDYRDFELLLVDDGSTDESTALAQSYAAREPDRVKYLHHPGKVNRGMSATRNLGIQAARGELISFIDADDRWGPNKLREQVAIFERFPEVDGSAGTVNYWRSWDGGQDELIPTGHDQDRPIPPPEASLRLYPLGRAAAPCPSDLMLRRSAVLDVGGFEASFTGPLQMYEDQAFLSKFYLERTMYFASSSWLDYRLHNASCMASVRGAGRYDEVREHFLRWLQRYFAQRRPRPKLAVRLALQRALLRYRLPRLVSLARSVRRILRQR